MNVSNLKRVFEIGEIKDFHNISSTHKQELTIKMMDSNI